MQAQFLQERADACSEEGLAIVNQFMYEKDTRLWRPALMYYAAARGAELSFKDLFHDLGAYVQVRVVVTTANSSMQLLQCLKLNQVRPWEIYCFSNVVIQLFA